MTSNPAVNSDIRRTFSSLKSSASKTDKISQVFSRQSIAPEETRPRSLKLSTEFKRSPSAAREISPKTWATRGLR